MKRILIWTAVLAAVWGLPRLSHPAVDIGKLEPVETVLLNGWESGMTVLTDSGAKGSGTTLTEAVEDLRRSADAEVYLDTANKILITGEMGSHWQEVLGMFRPSCHVCIVDPDVDLEEAAGYLTLHPPKMTLNGLRAGQRDWEKLTIKEGRGALAPE